MTTGGTDLTTAPPVPIAGWRDLLAWALGRRARFKVSGDSMHPTLRRGEGLLVRPQTPASAGDVVAVRHPAKSGLVLVKRVREVRSDGRLDLRGDNPGASTDSRDFGPLPQEQVLGVVIGKLPA